MAFTQVIKTLGSVMASMKSAVDTWLSENITNPSNPPLDRSLSLSNACAPADLVGDLKNELDENAKLLNDGFDIVTNFIYSDDVNWNPTLLDPVFQGDDLVVIAPTTTSGNTYVGAEVRIDTTNIQYITISYESITGDTGTNPRIRYGHIINGTESWDGFTAGTTVIDCSTYDTVKIAFYEYFNKPAVANAKAYFKKVQVETGSIAHDFVKEPTVIGVKAGETGNVDYFGERINIGELKESHSCDFDVWKNFTDVSQYELYKNQSVAIYGGYAFLFQNGGDAVVIDYSTKEIVGTMTLESVSSNHQNSAQFTDIFFADGDEFPLILISRCGNSETSSPTPAPGTDGCLVCRITRSGSSFAITLKNLIALDVSTFGSSWGYDSIGKKICVETYMNGTYRVTINNPVYIYSFDMPSKEDILSGHQITLNVSDAVNTYILPYFTLQGIARLGSYVFSAAQNTEGNWLLITDTNRGIIVSKVPLPQDFEPEGVTIYNNDIYVSARKGTDTSGTNPCKIYTISA